ncbi:hypothetical protein T08_12507 [Trichinella sp. T8]|nr:hypothetical protein T08_12507 [Trichinella sp. T8]
MRSLEKRHPFVLLRSCLRSAVDWYCTFVSRRQLPRDLLNAYANAIMLLGRKDKEGRNLVVWTDLEVPAVIDRKDHVENCRVD